MWINLNKVSNDDQWVTGPDAHASYFDWAPQEPTDHSDSRCAALSPDLNYKWRSVPCGKVFPFVCEVELATE